MIANLYTSPQPTPISLHQIFIEPSEETFLYTLQMLTRTIPDSATEEPTFLQNNTSAKQHTIILRPSFSHLPITSFCYNPRHYPFKYQNLPQHPHHKSPPHDKRPHTNYIQITTKPIYIPSPPQRLITAENLKAFKTDVAAKFTDTYTLDSETPTEIDSEITS